MKVDCNNIYFKYTKTFGKYSRNILFSKLFVISTILFISTITLMVLLISSLNNGYNIFDHSTYGSSYGILTALFALTYISSISGVMGDLYMDRLSKVAMPFYLLYILTYSIQCWYWALYYELLQQAIVLFFVIKTFITWNGVKYTNEPVKMLSKKNMYITLIIIIVVTIILGSIMNWVINPLIENSIIIVDGSIDSSLTPWWAIRGIDPLPFLDALVVLSFLISWYLFSKKYLNAYWVMLISIIVYFIIYAIFIFAYGQHNYIIYFITNFFYLFLNQTGMCNWTNEFINNVKKQEMKL